MKMPLTATMEPQCYDALTISVDADGDKVAMTVGDYRDEEDTLHRLRINVVTRECVELILSKEDALLLASRLIGATAKTSTGSAEDQHPDAIAARNYMANAKRMREVGR